MLRGTVRNYLAWTALAVAGGLMATQAKSDQRASGAAPDDRVVVEMSQRSCDGVIEVGNDLAIREGPRELARAERDAGAASGPA